MATETAPTLPAMPDLNAATSWLDITNVALIVAAALVYLYFKWWKNKGRCAGCNRCGKTPRQPRCQSIGTIATLRPLDNNAPVPPASQQKG